MSVENNLEGLLRFSQRMDLADPDLQSRQKPTVAPVQPDNKPENPKRRLFLTRTVPALTFAGATFNPLEYLTVQNTEAEMNTPMYAYISPNNPVLNLSANPDLDKQDPTDYRKRLVETIYAQKNSLGENDPRPFSAADIEAGLHPLGPYGDKILQYARKYARQIGLPADVLAVYIASESFHESLWNGTSNQNSPEQIKRAVTAGYGIMQLMTREDGLGPEAPTYEEVDTVDKQLDWIFRDIRKASGKVRTRGRQFTIKDLNYYFIGQSTGTNDIYERFETKMIFDTKVFLRNMAIFDPTGKDLINLFENLQSQNGDSVSRSLTNFHTSFDSLTYPPEVVSVPHGSQEISWRPSHKVLELAYYLDLKYHGNYHAAYLDRQMLIGFSNEEIYWALAINGGSVVNYADLAQSSFNPNLTENKNGETKTLVRLGDFLTSSHPNTIYQSTEL